MRILIGGLLNCCSGNGSAPAPNLLDSLLPPLPLDIVPAAYVNSHTLWYFADPMCSWCWGFAPVIDAIKAHYGDGLKIALVLGGLRPGTTEPLAPETRAEILHHWHEVQRRTGQPFAFEGALPEGFVYDTEPPSRAVIAISGLNPEATLPFFKRIQATFYAEGRDVTQPDTLAALAETFDIAPAQFHPAFASSEAIEVTRRHFEHTRRAGVTGFPTTVLQHGEKLELLNSGYRAFDDLKPQIESWLSS